MKRLFCALIALTAMLLSSNYAKARINGDRWLDNDSTLINCHGGGVLFHNGLYYWYGEHRPEKGFSTSRGVSCYSSPNLRDWKFEGIALSVEEDDANGVVPGCIIERPKVVFNPKTGKFVMWFHHELKGRGYEAAQAGTAIADTPSGPFKMLRSGRVNPGKMPLNLQKAPNPPAYDEKEEWWTPEWHEKVNRGLFTLRDLPGGQMARDMTIYVDDNGKAYHIYSSEENLTLQIAELTDDYTAHTGRYIRIFPGGHNEAPALFKQDGRYWLLASGCTGWAPNEARIMCADDMLGDWERLPNPCVGPDAEKTFLGQSAFVLTLPEEDKIRDSPSRHIAVFDRWNPRSLAESRYLWLPVSFTPEGRPQIIWNEEFNGL